jgi:hypothetical protein
MGLLDRRSGVRKISEVVPLTRRLIRDPCGAEPTWLLNAHEDLDRAVFAAYGWPPDLSDEEVLLELLTSTWNDPRLIGKSPANPPNCG